MRYILLLTLLLANPGYSGEPLRIAVAANFRATLQRASDLFQQETGIPVVLSSGSTGVLYSQIVHGAPFDAFFAADRESTVKLARAAIGGTRQEPFCYARGTLVLAGGTLTELTDPNLSLAIANPVTAPYGVAAMAVLERPEFVAGANRKLVRGTNVVQALQFWRSGATDLALLPAALAPQATVISDRWHLPLDQFAIALHPVSTHPALASYLNWIRSDRVRALISDAGYQPCP